MASVGTSLSYSTIHDQVAETGNLKKRIHTNKTLSHTHSKPSKNKTRKRSHQVSSMLAFMQKQDAGNDNYMNMDDDNNMEDNRLDETFEMLKPQMSSREMNQENDDDHSDGNDSDDDNERPSFLKQQKRVHKMRPMLDSDQSRDAVQFSDPQRYAQLVKDYGEDMLKSWASNDGAGQMSVDTQRKKVQEGFTGFTGGSVPYHGDMSGDNVPRDAMMEKMNYMIHLLEDQKEQRTETVSEELILYLFLGIFVIFVSDSFTRIGKYQR